MAWASLLHRAQISDLLFENRHALAELRSILSEKLFSLPPGSYGSGSLTTQDPTFASSSPRGSVQTELCDFWLLRYVISFKDIQAAADAAVRAFAWRREHMELVEAAKSRLMPPGITADDLASINRCWLSRFCGTTTLGDPVLVTRASRLVELMDSVSEEHLEVWLHFVRECSWQYCEAEARERGWFVQQLDVDDLDDVGTTPGRHDKRYDRILSKIKETDAWLRPGLLGGMFVLNAPASSRVTSRLTRLFISTPSSMVWVHKGKVGAAAGTRGEIPFLCPFATELLGGAEGFPRFLGGSMSAADEAALFSADGIALAGSATFTFSCAAELLCVARLPLPCKPDLEAGTASLSESTKTTPMPSDDSLEPALKVSLLGELGAPPPEGLGHLEPVGAVGRRCCPRRCGGSSLTED